MTTRDVVKAYFTAVATKDLVEMEKWMHSELEVVEHPNTYSPQGRRYKKADLVSSAKEGVQLMSGETYDVLDMIVEGDKAAVWLTWKGTLGPQGFGTLSPGVELKAQIVSVVRVKDDKIWRQEQYDCFHA